MNEFIQGIPGDLDAPHMEQYFGPWAMKEDVFRAAFDRVSRMDLRLHVERVKATQEAEASDDDPDRGGAPSTPAMSYPVTQSGIAVLQLTGTLMKHVGSLEAGTSTVLFRRQLRAAMNNPAIAGIMVLIDSPGGSVAGTYELAADIAAAAKKKPTHAFIQDLGASAAYWAASQTTVISCNVMAIVGSIGTFMPIFDFSGWAAKEGIRVEIIKEGEFKGAGTPGTKITDEQIAEWQRMVTSLNTQFVVGPFGVATGRGISADEAKKLNDGRVHVGAAAKSMKLVDHVESFEKALTRLETASKSKQSGGARSELPLDNPPKSRMDKLNERRNPKNEAEEQTDMNHRIEITAGNKTLAYTAPSGDAVLALANAHRDQTKQTAGTSGDTESTPEAAAGDVPPSDGAEGKQTEGETSEKGSAMAGQTTPAPDAKATEQKQAEPLLASVSIKAASAVEIEQACPGASDSFVLGCVKQNMTLGQAKDAFIGWQSDQLKQRDEQLAATPKQPAAKAPGVAPVASAAAEQLQKNRTGGSAATGDESAVAEFEQRVDARMKRHNEERHIASAKVLSDDPELRQRYNTEQNENRKERVRARQQELAANAR
jgi:protease-4